MYKILLLLLLSKPKTLQHQIFMFEVCFQLPPRLRLCFSPLFMSVCLVDCLS